MKNEYKWISTILWKLEAKATKINVTCIRNYKTIDRRETFVEKLRKYLLEHLEHYFPRVIKLYCEFYHHLKLSRMEFLMWKKWDTQKLRQSAIQARCSHSHLCRHSEIEIGFLYIKFVSIACRWVTGKNAGKNDFQFLNKSFHNFLSTFPL